MKLMDTAGGVCAMLHAHSNVVTASLDSLDMHSPIFNSNLVSVHAQPTFSSAKSLEVEVTVVAEDVFSNNKQIAASAFLTFVSLDPQGKVQAMPEVDCLHMEAYSEAKQRYEYRKQRRKEGW